MIKRLIVFSTVLVVFTFTIVYLSFEQPKDKPAKKNERYYQTILCQHLNGQAEFRLKDKTRVDCLTDEYAIEVDWAKKWAEGIGQSLYYAEMTNKKPAVALIVGKKDQRYLNRLQTISDKLAIKVFIIDKGLKE